MNIVERVKKLLLSPTAEWGVIKAETHTVVDLYTHYVMILAAIPAVANFIGWSIVGYSGFGTMTYRIPLAAGVATMVLNYLLTLGSVYLLALIIDMQAPNFGGERDFIQALKVAAFFPTAAWLAGIFFILPALTILALVGALYSLWLLYTGLGPLMEIPEVIGAIAGLAMPSRSRGF